MKKTILTLLFLIISQYAFADSISTDKSDFQKDEQRWEEELKKEQAKPSEFEGGSMAPMDHNMRMTAFVEKRITELKQKWLKR